MYYKNGKLATRDSLTPLSRIVNYELGHSNLSATMDTYSHVTTKIKNDSVNIFENIIATIK